MQTCSIFGPPGTGKTTHLMRLAGECAERIGSVLITSHTKAAAQEIASRSGACKAGTIHSVAFQLLKLRRQQVMGWESYQELARLTGVRITGSSDDDVLQIGDKYLQLIAFARAKGKTLDEVLRTGQHDINQAECLWFARSLDSYKQAHFFIDFQDMLDKCLEQKLCPECDVLMVDEAQDLSPVQWRLIRMWGENTRVVYFAGDDDQSIHEWAGADPLSMLEADKHKVLDHSFRLSDEHVDFAQQAVKVISQRKEKEWAGKGKGLPVEFVPDLHSTDLNSALLLCRTNRMCKDTAHMLMDRGVPVKFGKDGGPLFGKVATAALNWERYRKMGVDKMPDRVLGDIARLSRTKPTEEQANRPWYSLFHKTNEARYMEKVWKEHGTFTPACTTEISTIHGAKGREAENVVVYNSLPKAVAANMSGNLDSEARVWYVAFTRSLSRMTVVEGDNPFPIRRR